MVGAEAELVPLGYDVERSVLRKQARPSKRQKIRNETTQEVAESDKRKPGEKQGSCSTSSLLWQGILTSFFAHFQTGEALLPRLCIISSNCQHVRSHPVMEVVSEHNALREHAACTLKSVFKSWMLRGPIRRQSVIVSLPSCVCLFESLVSAELCL